MRRMVIALRVLAICFCGSACSSISELKTFDELSSRIKDGDWVILDLDQTVMESKTSWGSSGWIYAMVDQMVGEGMDRGEAFRRTSLPFHRSQRFVKVQPMEDNTVAVLNAIIDKGYVVFGCTAREANNAAPTVDHLYDLGIDLDSSAPVKALIDFDFEVGLAKFFEGVLFCDNNGKGRVLAALLDYLQNEGVAKPHRVVFVDDLVSNVESVERMLTKMGIEVIGLHYTRGALRQCENRLDVVNLQSECASRILSDAEARLLFDSSLPAAAL